MANVSSKSTKVKDTLHALAEMTKEERERLFDRVVEIYCMSCGEELNDDMLCKDETCRAEEDEDDEDDEDDDVLDDEEDDDLDDTDDDDDDEDDDEDDFDLDDEDDEDDNANDEVQ